MYRHVHQAEERQWVWSVWRRNKNQFYDSLLPKAPSIQVTPVLCVLNAHLCLFITVDKWGFWSLSLSLVHSATGPLCKWCPTSVRRRTAGVYWASAEWQQGFLRSLATHFHILIQFFSKSTRKDTDGEIHLFYLLKSHILPRCSWLWIQRFPSVSPPGPGGDEVRLWLHQHIPYNSARPQRSHTKGDGRMFTGRRRKGRIDEKDLKGDSTASQTLPSSL